MTPKGSVAMGTAAVLRRRDLAVGGRTGGSVGRAAGAAAGDGTGVSGFAAAGGSRRVAGRPVPLPPPGDRVQTVLETVEAGQQVQRIGSARRQAHLGHEQFQVQPGSGCTTQFGQSFRVHRRCG